MNPNNLSQLIVVKIKSDNCRLIIYMAKKAVVKKQKSIEESLWDSANKLRGSVEPSEYKHVVLGLIFLKFASDKFEARKEELIAEGKEKYIKMKEFYNMKNVFFLQEQSRWNFIIQNAKQNDIAIKIDTALHTIEKNNPELKGALPDNYFSRLDLERTCFGCPRHGKAADGKSSSRSSRRKCGSESVPNRRGNHRHASRDCASRNRQAPSD